MSVPESMPPARRRPIPGMAVTAAAPPPPQHSSKTDAVDSPEAFSRAALPPTTSTCRTQSSAPPAAANGRVTEASAAAGSGGRDQRRAADYASTRLVNFRIPVDLHDRYRQLMRDAEDARPRLRRPSLPELVIALMEEGPQTADEVAELIRRKRAAEHAESRS